MFLATSCLVTEYIQTPLNCYYFITDVVMFNLYTGFVFRCLNRDFVIVGFFVTYLFLIVCLFSFRNY